MDLPRHLQRIAIHRIAPAFDMDRVRSAIQSQLGDDVCPAGVTKTGRAHEDEGVLAGIANAAILVTRSAMSATPGKSPTR